MKVGVWSKESQRRGNGLKKAAYGCPAALSVGK